MSKYAPYVIGAILWPIIFPILFAGWLIITTVIVCALAYAFGSALHPVIGTIAVVIAAIIWIAPQAWLFSRLWRNTQSGDAPQTGLGRFAVNPLRFTGRKLRGE